uniref:Neurotransmitter-gated ion-channel ligand-binding domain-containing protein n=1 Tax=Romanomermis culicivorax TaxID=13658 RepID=A0A915IE89_ROMCU
FDSNFGATLPVNFVVQSSGTITWIPPGILKSLCQQVGVFPYNSQRCFFKCMCIDYLRAWNLIKLTKILTLKNK